MSIDFSQRFRRHVAPYDVSHSLAVLAGPNYCPALQTIRSCGLPNVDRTTVPTVIAASLMASAKDKSGHIASVMDSAVTNIKWYVQRSTETTGTDITQHTAWANKFTIGSGNDKGKLFVNLNIPAGVTWKIWMQCTISDQRRGYAVPIPVVTESVILYSIADADEPFTMSIDRPSSEIYEPARDARLIHEYLTGLGMAHDFTDDGNTYLRDVTAVLRRGGTALDASEYTVKVYSIDTIGNKTEVTADTDGCISAITDNVVTFDLRFAKTATYQIICFVGAEQASQKTYGWAWSNDMPTSDEGVVGGATYTDGTQQTFFIKLNLGKSMLKYPTVAFDLKWHWKKPGSTTKNYIGSGERHTYDLTYADMFNGSEADAVLTVDKRGAFSTIATSTAGSDVYTDADGNVLIAN